MPHDKVLIVLLLKFIGSRLAGVIGRNADIYANPLTHIIVVIIRLFALREKLIVGFIDLHTNALSDSPLLFSV